MAYTVSYWTVDEERIRAAERVYPPYGGLHSYGACERQLCTACAVRLMIAGHIDMQPMHVDWQDYLGAQSGDVSHPIDSMDISEYEHWIHE